MKNSDKPAYPCVQKILIPSSLGGKDEVKIDHVGLTKREYAMIHAPSEIPEWFSVEKFRPSVQKFDPYLNRNDKEFMFAFESLRVNNQTDFAKKVLESNETYMLTSGFKKWATEIIALEDFKANIKEIKYFMWREYFATKILGDEKERLIEESNGKLKNKPHDDKSQNSSSEA